MKANVITLCSGYDSQCMALDELKKNHPDFDYELIAWSEIDKYAIQMHNLVYPQWSDRNVGDMTEVDWTKVKEPIDLLTYSTPCQDISQAGKQRGLTEGDDTRSAILWATENAIRELKPRFLMQENVKALVSKKFMPDFLKWCERVQSYGYTNYWKVLNAKDYGVPQNRERVFMISVRNDVVLKYKFPDPMPLKKLLEDVLEEEVEEKYFLNDDAVGKFLSVNNKDNAVFVQFSLPPAHEDAMFLKTWLTRWMAEHDGWSMTPEQLKDSIEQAKSEFPENWRESDFMYDPDFVAEYEENLKRKQE